MTEPTTPVRTAREVAERVYRMVEHGDVTLADLFAADGVLEYPFTGPGMPSRIEGRDAIAEFHGNLSRLRTRIAREGVGWTLHETADPQVVIVEIEHHGRILPEGKPYQSIAVGVMRVRDGEIVSYRDYMNPLTVAAIAGVDLPGPASSE
ncbi:MAG: nuclear transport factor 2 family protein [Acidothermales bacterium]|nr:nuclear transport factor 2 family protein [Acidothermales bacterium]